MIPWFRQRAHLGTRLVTLAVVGSTILVALGLATRRGRLLATSSAGSPLELAITTQARNELRENRFFD